MAPYSRPTGVAVLALALGLTLAACGEDEDGPEPQSPEGTAQSSGGTSESSGGTAESSGGSAEPSSPAAPPGGGGGQVQGADGADLTARGIRAIATAEQKAGGTAYAIDRSERTGDWEVDVAAGDRSIEVTLVPDGRSVIRTESDDLDGEDRRGLEQGDTGLDEAISLTVDAHGGDLDEAELEEDDGAYRWSVTLRSGGGGGGGRDMDYLVDPATGELTRDEDSED